MTEPKIQALIDFYHLTPLPVEGTLYASSWRSQSNFPNGDPHGTAMIGMYCQQPLSQSCFHRLNADEVWHFYGGDPLRLVLLFPNGSHTEVIMGGDFANGQRVQLVVPAGTWQAGHLVDGGLYTLFGCTMAPGFTGAMYEGARRNDLIKNYPNCQADILQLTPAIDEIIMPDGFAP